MTELGSRIGGLWWYGGRGRRGLPVRPGGAAFLFTPEQITRTPLGTCPIAANLSHWNLEHVSASQPAPLIFCLQPATPLKLRKISPNLFAQIFETRFGCCRIQRKLEMKIFSNYGSKRRDGLSWLSYLLESFSAGIVNNQSWKESQQQNSIL